MLYGDEKYREMARSILPSRARGYARYKKAAKCRRLRRRMNQALRVLEPQDYEDLDTFNPDQEESWDLYLGNRRGADKLNHFEKWAIKVTAHLESAEERQAFIRSVLPDGLIGFHAMSHLVNYDEFKLNPWKRGLRNTGKTDGLKAQQAQDDQLRNTLTSVLSKPGAHRWFNLYMRQRHQRVHWWYEVPKTRFNPQGKEAVPVGPARPRLLRGVGDIYAFISDVRAASTNPHVTVEPYTEGRNSVVWEKNESGILMRVDGSRIEKKQTKRTNPNYHPEWLQSCIMFCDTWNSCGGDILQVAAQLEIQQPEELPTFNRNHRGKRS